MNNKGHLYVIEFSTGVIKVGRSVNPATRLKEHTREAGRYGVTVLNAWASAEHEGIVQSERQLVDYARTQGTEAGGYEYFKGASFDAIKEYAESIDHNACADLATKERKVLDPEFVKQGQVVRAEFDARGLTTRQVAKKSGVSYEIINARLKGHYGFNIAHCAHIASALDMSLRDLVGRMAA
jgi:predicted GIY-YIG superfamily endonuclease